MLPSAQHLRTRWREGQLPRSAAAAALSTARVRWATPPPTATTPRPTAPTLPTTPTIPTARTAARTRSALPLAPRPHLDASGLRPARPLPSRAIAHRGFIALPTGGKEQPHWLAIGGGGGGSNGRGRGSSRRWKNRRSHCASTSTTGGGDDYGRATDGAPSGSGGGGGPSEIRPRDAFLEAHLPWGKRRRMSGNLRWKMSGGGRVPRQAFCFLRDFCVVCFFLSAGRQSFFLRVSV